MIYVSIDIEGTGIDPETCQTLSVGLVVEDTANPKPLDELPTLHVAILRENIQGSMFAINMNRDLIESIVQYQTAKDQDEKNDLVHMTRTLYVKEEDVTKTIFRFLYDNGAIESRELNGAIEVVNGKTYPALTSSMKPYHFNAAGKNFGTFDLKFLEKLPRWKQVFRVRNRILDPAILFVDWKEDESVPGLGKCKERANFDSHVSHHAVEDAMDVVKLLRTQYA
jgi:hypothetical protein